MVSKSAIKDTPTLIKELLTDRFGETAPITEYLCPIITTFASSNCSDKHFMSEICSGDDGKFWSRTWEAVLYGRLCRCKGWSISSRDGGMDFLLTNGEKSVLVDAIVPAPEGIPCEWLTEHDGVYSMPDDKVLLRWTHSIDTKQKKYASDVEKGTISAGQPFVIAVNSCRLSRSPDDHGITQWPFAVEAVFPVGPIVVPIDKGAKKYGNAFQSLRFSVQKSGTPIPTNSFLCTAYEHVSAVLGCSACFADNATQETFCGFPPMILVHNPLAKNPLPIGWLPGAIEYYAIQENPDEFTLKRAPA